MKQIADMDKLQQQKFTCSTFVVAWHSLFCIIRPGYFHKKVNKTHLLLILCALISFGGTITITSPECKSDLFFYAGMNQNSF